MLCYHYMDGNFTIAIFIGTIAGNVISHSILSLIFIILPSGIGMLLFHFAWIHTNVSTTEFFLKKTNYASYIENIEVFAPTNNTYISYTFNPKVKEDGNNNSKESVKEHHQFMPIWKISTPILYILILLPLGVFLYDRTPNENSGKILLFTKLHVLFIPCATICFALLGGRITGGKNDPLLNYYTGFIIIGLFSYVILNYLVNKKFYFIRNNLLLKRRLFHILSPIPIHHLFFHPKSITILHNLLCRCNYTFGNFPFPTLFYKYL